MSGVAVLLPTHEAEPSNRDEAVATFPHTSATVLVEQQGNHVTVEVAERITFTQPWNGTKTVDRFVFYPDQFSGTALVTVPIPGGAWDLWGLVEFNIEPPDVFFDGQYSELV